MSEPSADLTRLARQHLQTSQLLGVPFAPVAIDLTHDIAQSTDSGADHLEPGADTIPDAATTSLYAGSAKPDLRTKEDRKKALDDLRKRHEQTTRCQEYLAANPHGRIVFGEGHPNAELMFIGEAPGADEERTGRPFVGRAGQKLDQIIEAMGLQREQVYIANVLKTRPPNNRTPQPDEVAAEWPYLREQIAVIEPRVIVTLGGPATKRILDTKQGITSLRGRWAEYIDEEYGLQIPVMPTFHPAYLLRNYTKETRQQMWSDMQQVVQRLGDQA